MKILRRKRAAIPRARAEKTPSFMHSHRRGLLGCSSAVNSQCWLCAVFSFFTCTVSCVCRQGTVMSTKGSRKGGKKSAGIGQRPFFFVCFIFDPPAFPPFDQLQPFPSFFQARRAIVGRVTARPRVRQRAPVRRAPTSPRTRTPSRKTTAWFFASAHPPPSPHPWQLLLLPLPLPPPCLWLLLLLLRRQRPRRRPRVQAMVSGSVSGRRGPCSLRFAS